MQSVPPPPRLPGPAGFGPLPLVPDLPAAPSGAAGRKAPPDVNASASGPGGLPWQIQALARAAALGNVAPAGLAQFTSALQGRSALPEEARALPLDPRSQLQSMLADGTRSEIPAGSAAEAAKDFAGILFGYMFSEMRPKEDEGGLLGGGDSELFMDFFDRAMGRHFVDGAGGSLVEALIAQLTKAADRK